MAKPRVSALGLPPRYRRHALSGLDALIARTEGELAERLRAVERLAAAGKGTAVYDRRGERLGEVYNFMVDKRSGQVAYAVMSFGGFLGVGGSYHPLPWRSLTYDTNLGGYVVDLDKATLRARARAGTGPTAAASTSATGCRPTTSDRTAPSRSRHPGRGGAATSVRRSGPCRGYPRAG